MKPPTLLDYIESAYLHGLPTDNYDDGTLEPPKDISDVKWIEKAIQALVRSCIPEKDPNENSKSKTAQAIAIGRNQAISEIEEALKGKGLM